MANFTGQLRSNEIMGALFNMIISQRVFSDNIQKTQTLVDEAKEEAGLFGDQKIYYAADVLGTNPWGVNNTHPKGGVMDVEAANLLSLDRPADPEQQSLVIDTFRQVRLTTDNYISKRAWSTETAFADFTSVMLGMIDTAKRIYEGTLYNVFIGTTKSASAAQNITVDLDAGASDNESGLDLAKLEAMNIAKTLADLFVKMGDFTRDYNDYHFMRTYSGENIKVIWNSDYVNKIHKVDLPTIFHRDGLVDKFDEYHLPAKYFGTINASAKTAAAGDLSMLEKDYTVSGVKTHVFPGEQIPVGASVAANESYRADSTVICKVLVKLPPMLSAFSVATSFFNPRSLTENHYLTWGHSTLEYLKNYPFITVKAQ